MEIHSFISDFEDVPKNIQEQVFDYFEYLMTKYKNKEKQKKKFSFDWEGGLSELKNEYTSVELQHHANDLR